jgi:hypothetical protein
MDAEKKYIVKIKFDVDLGRYSGKRYCDFDKIPEDTCVYPGGYMGIAGGDIVIFRESEIDAVEEHTNMVRVLITDDITNPNHFGKEYRAVLIKDGSMFDGYFRAFNDDPDNDNFGIFAPSEIEVVGTV